MPAGMEGEGGAEFAADAEGGVVGSAAARLAGAVLTLACASSACCIVFISVRVGVAVCLLAAAAGVRIFVVAAMLCPLRLVPSGLAITLTVNVTPRRAGARHMRSRGDSWKRETQRSGSKFFTGDFIARHLLLELLPLHCWLSLLPPTCRVTACALKGNARRPIEFLGDDAPPASPSPASQHGISSAAFAH